MTADDYYEIVKAMGVKLLRKTSTGEEWVARNKDNAVTIVPAPEEMTPEEREDALVLLKRRHGFSDC